MDLTEQLSPLSGPISETQKPEQDSGSARDGSPEWRARTRELEEVEALLEKVKAWLTARDRRAEGAAPPVAAEVVMQELGLSGWKSLGVVNAALRDHYGTLDLATQPSNHFK